MKIDKEDFNRKAQHIVETVVKPQVEKYERAKAIEEAAANLADPNADKTENWIAGAKWMAERMYTKENLCDAFYAHNDTWLDFEQWLNNLNNNRNEGKTIKEN